MPADKIGAKAKADEIRGKYNPRDLTPFPFEKVSKGENIRISLVDSDFFRDLERNSSGVIYLSRKGGVLDFVVLVNKDDSFERRNFTLAHELGHFFLHKSDLLSGTDEINYIIDHDDPLFVEGEPMFRDILPKGSNNEKEIEANHFAANLLMPEVLVRDAWKQFNDIEKCAKVFVVSLSAMSLRLKNLGLID